ncbi:MAG: transposase [Elusimicrobia bacterium]|nr:transposase [Elusimicrobiota bacterium]
MRCLLPRAKSAWRRRDRKGGRPMLEERACFEAVLWYLSRRGPWRKLPGRFGSARTIQRRIMAWRLQGTLDALWQRYLEQRTVEDRQAWRRALTPDRGDRRRQWYWEMLGLVRACSRDDR